MPLFLREWFQAAVAEDGGRSGAGGSLPQILISAGGRVKPLGNQIRILWETAQSSDAIPYSRWKELQPMMMEMIRRRQAGEWRFAAEVRS